MLHFIAFIEYGHLRTWHMNNAGKMVYRKRSRVVSILLQLENKQQIMPNNVDTQKKHMYTCIRDIVVHVVCVI